MRSSCSAHPSQATTVSSAASTNHRTAYTPSAAGKLITPCIDCNRCLCALEAARSLQPAAVEDTLCKLYSASMAAYHQLQVGADASILLKP